MPARLRNPPAGRSSRGFSLLEVLVAFVILGLVLGTLMEIFSGGLRQVSRAAEYQQAVLLGQSRLAAVGIELPLKEGDSSGEFDATYRWQTSIRSLPDSELGVTEEAGAAPVLLPVTLLEIDMRVLWGSPEQPRSLSLKTVRVGNKAKP